MAAIRVPCIVEILYHNVFRKWVVFFIIGLAAKSPQAVAMEMGKRMESSVKFSFSSLSMWPPQTLSVTLSLTSNPSYNTQVPAVCFFQKVFPTYLG